MSQRDTECLHRARTGECIESSSKFARLGARSNEIYVVFTCIAEFFAALVALVALCSPSSSYVAIAATEQQPATGRPQANTRQREHSSHWLAPMARLLIPSLGGSTRHWLGHFSCGLAQGVHSGRSSHWARLGLRRFA